MAINSSQLDKAIFLVQNYKKRAIPVSYATAGIVKLLRIRCQNKSARVMIELNKDTPDKDLIKQILYE